MRLRKNAVMCVMVLTILIASSASGPIIENDSAVTTRPLRYYWETISTYRLPNNTIPRLYNIHIEPNMNGEILTWTGKTSIDIEVKVPTSVLTLHVHHNLVINKNFTELVDFNGTKITPIEHDYNDILEQLHLKFNDEIPVGNYSLSLKYEGEDTLEDVGFYKASQQDAPMVAGTHFEATTARRAFPCWDEPGLKARFRVSIKHFPNYTAISNMPEIEHVETPDGKILTTFDTTPIMSTYLLTFVIADYQKVDNENRNVSLYTPKSRLEKSMHLLDLSPKVVKVMESYTGFPYGFPRLGSVLLSRYTAAATEHWGLVSYNEAAIIFNASSDTTKQKDRIEMLIAHELSHSWFGNRVTPLWWDDLWLNEGFAAYFQYYILDKIYDNWGGVDLFVLRNNQEIAFPGDDDERIPVKWTPDSNRQIRYLFGSTTYRKGSALIHMFRNILGDDIFRAGIQKFLGKYSFKPAEAEDLMSSLQEAYDEGPNKGKPLNLKDVMTSWLVQKGYPIVYVTRNYTTGETEVSQNSSLKYSVSNKWWIPLNYATKSSLNFSSTLPMSWISDKEDSVKIGGIDKDDWIIMNIRASGYYRVNYDNENWNRLADYLNSDNYKNIHMLNRAQLINDAFYIAQNDQDMYLRNFYKLTKYLSREIEYLPWRSAYNAIETIEEALRHTEVYNMFVRYILELMHNFIEKVGFEVQDTDDHFTKLSRTDVIRWACMNGQTACSEFATKKVMKLVENPVQNRLHPDIKSWTFCAGLRGLNDTEANKFANWAYENESELLFEMLGCTENHEIHGRILNNTLMTNITDDWYNTYKPFRTLLLSTDENFNFAIDYFLENHQAMNNTEATFGRTYAASDIVSDMYFEVKTRPRLEKLKQVLLLDAVLGDPKIPKTVIMSAESEIAKADASAAPYIKLWDKQLLTDNSISGCSQQQHC